MVPKSLEELLALGPISPPAGVGDPRPVLPVTQQAAVASIRAAAMWLNSMADHVDQAPWADGLFDEYNRLLADMLTAAADAVVRFRATRECEGQA